MRLQIEYDIYEGTPEEIAEQMWQGCFYRYDFKNAMEYIQYLSETFERITDIPCPLPSGSLDKVARAFFEKMAEIDVAEVWEDCDE